LSFRSYYFLLVGVAATVKSGHLVIWSSGHSMFCPSLEFENGGECVSSFLFAQLRFPGGKYRPIGNRHFVEIHRDC